MNVFAKLSAKNKILIISTIALIVVVVPLTIFQALKQQETRQRASSNTLGFSIMLSPAGLTKNIGESMEVEIHLLNSEQREVSAVDVSYGDYNPNMFESVSFQPSTEFNMIIGDLGHYVGIAFPDSHKNAADITLGRVKFEKSKEAGVFALDIKSMRINVAGKRDAAIPETVRGSYRIETAKASPGTAGGVVLPTQTLAPSLVPTLSVSSPTPTPQETPYSGGGGADD